MTLSDLPSLLGKFELPSFEEWKAKACLSEGGQPASFEALSSQIPGGLKINPLYVSSQAVQLPILSHAKRLKKVVSTHYDTKALQVIFPGVKAWNEIELYSPDPLVDLKKLKKVIGALQDRIPAITLSIAAQQNLLSELLVNDQPTCFMLGLTNRFNSWQPWLEIVPTLLKNSELRLGLDLRWCAEAGGSAIEECAFACAALIDFLRAATTQGYDLTSLWSKLRIGLSVGPDFYVEIAKLRALRLMVARVAEVLQVSSHTSAAPPSDPGLFACPSRWNLGRVSPHTNLIRFSSQVLAAVFGGAHFVALPAYDEADVDASSALRTARDLLYVMDREGHVSDVEDPALGSPYVDTLTASIAERGWGSLQQIEERGGFVKTLTQGYLAEMLAPLRAERSARIGDARSVLVGINKYSEYPQTTGDSLFIPQAYCNPMGEPR